jgi:UDP-N-acetylmuramoyl-tripeptide--D-alanyl-D-alanine ligase
MPLSFGRFLEVSGGRFLADAKALPLEFIPSTDSRTLERGNVFVCLRGDQFDGHDFVAAALSRGCAAVVVDDDAKAPHASGVPVIRVADTKQAYLAGATAARSAFRGRVIGVTGSTGKTTTKEMTAQLLARHKRVAATPNNENNELGVAKLCYALDAATEVAVFEFGARHPGEIAQLVDIAQPHIGVLTNIGEAHLEFFRDQEELARTKFALFGRGAQPICSAADSWSRMLAAEQQLESKTIWVRLCGDAQASGIMLEAGVPCDGRVPVTLGASHTFAAWPLLGDHTLRDALLACGAAISTGVSFEAAVAGFASLRLPAGRFEIHRTERGTMIVYDAYNASPASVAHALGAFAQLPAARHIAVLGSMAELGAQARSQHEATGAAAARSGVSMLFCGGEYGDALARGARGAGLPASAVAVYASNAEVTERLRAVLRADDGVLLKGSRVQHMEEILSGLLASGSLAS